MHASSIKGMDCLPSAGFLATHLYRSFYVQIYSSLIKVSLKATAWLVQLVYKADARPVGIYLLQKELFLGMKKRLVKGVDCMLSDHARAKPGDYS